MADNPRQPDQHSDIPSSRPSGGAPHPSAAPGGMYNAPQPPGPGTSKVHVRNLLIGAVITIITSTIIFYLTQYLKKPEGGDNSSRKKEATTEAWDSYLAYENIYTRNMLVLDTTVTDFDILLAETKKESGKFTKDLTDLKKKKYIDDDLIKVFDRRLENEKNFAPLVEKYINSIKALLQSNRPAMEKIAEQARLLEGWIKTYKSVYDRALNDIKEIAQLLSSRYPHPFDMNSFELVQKTPGQLHKLDSMLIVLQNTKLDKNGNIIVGLSFARNVKSSSVIGRWTTPGMDVILDPEGKVAWKVSNGAEAIGTWKIEKDKLKIEAVIKPDNKKVSWAFKLAYLTYNSFTLANDDPPFEIYRMTRVTE